MTWIILYHHKISYESFTVKKTIPEEVYNFINILGTIKSLVFDRVEEIDQK